MIWQDMVYDTIYYAQLCSMIHYILYVMVVIEFNLYYILHELLPA